MEDKTRVGKGDDREGRECMMGRTVTKSMQICRRNWPAAFCNKMINDKNIKAV